MTNMKKEEIVRVMKSWYMPNYFDLEMFDYTSLNEEEVYDVYLDELSIFGDELNEEIKKHL